MHADDTIDSRFLFTSSLKDRLRELMNVSEVFPNSEYAVLVFLFALDDGSAALWAAMKDTRVPCSPIEIFEDQQASRAAYATLVQDIVDYAYPDAVA